MVYPIVLISLFVLTQIPLEAYITMIGGNGDLNDIHLLTIQFMSNLCRLIALLINTYLRILLGVLPKSKLKELLNGQFPNN